MDYIKISNKSVVVPKQLHELEDVKLDVLKLLNGLSFYSASKLLDECRDYFQYYAVGSIDFTSQDENQ